MTTLPKVSIIIPAYNALPYLPQTVESALEQTFEDFELLIVNDGSTDGFRDWATCLNDKRIRIIHQDNQGLGAARNTGIKQAKGQYLAFLDADDLWLPTKLNEQIAELDTYPEIGLTHTSVSYIDAQGNKLRNDIRANGRGNVWRHVVAYNSYYLVLCGSTPLIRRECFDKVGMFSTELSFSQDWEMWIRIAHHYNFSTIQKPLVLYRQHGKNMSKSYTSALQSFHKIIEDTFSTVEPTLAYLKREAYGRVYMMMAWRAYRAGDHRAARNFQLRSLKLFPKLAFTKNYLHLTFRLMTRK